jgi:hypothetical protein
MIELQTVEHAETSKEIRKPGPYGILADGSSLSPVKMRLSACIVQMNKQKNVEQGNENSR